MSEIENYTFDERDEFKRKVIAKNITILLRSTIEVSPLMIDGDWGTGKTEFCYKLKNYMAKDDKERLIYINAFKADHSDEPLLSILAEIVNLLTPESQAQKQLIQKVLPAIKVLSKTLGKAAFNHIFRQNIDDISEDLSDAVTELSNKAIDSSVEAILKDHAKAKHNLEILQEALKELAKDKKIIIFIDELDRCRPDFAINMLEVIKHVFEVENIKFVLVANSKQLKASINHHYGKSIDAHRYLDKFFNYTFELPAKNIITGNNIAFEHFLELSNKSSLLNTLELNDQRINNIIRALIDNNQVSLRDIESIVKYLEIYQVITNKKIANDTAIGYKIYWLFSIFIYHISPELTDLILKGKIDRGLPKKILNPNPSADLASEKSRDIDSLYYLLTNPFNHYESSTALSNNVRANLSNIYDSWFKKESGNPTIFDANKFAKDNIQILLLTEDSQHK